MERLNILLCADYAYREQVLCTIKSICYHNKNVDFFLVNKDFPEEWFNHMASCLAPLNSRIFNIIMLYDFDKFQNPAHIKSSASYFRIFASEVVTTGKLLYLDCDVIVNANLSNFFNKIEFKENQLLAACPDVAMISRANKLNLELGKESYFNAGVMLLNIPLWKDEDITNKLLNTANEMRHLVNYGVQDIFNIVLKSRWQKLKLLCNYQAELIPASEKEKIEPLIIHYSGANKPWEKNDAKSFRNVYWSYYALSWIQIYNQQLTQPEIKQ